MAALLELKEHLKSFYSKFEAYIIPLLKFLTAMAALLLVNGELGYMSELNSLAIVLVAALFCSFLPQNFIIIFAAMFSVGHIYRLSLECAVGVLVLFMLLFFLYFRFSPKDTIVIVLTPVCFALKVPTVIPLAMGLVGGPASMISVGCGVIVYYVLNFIGSNAVMINSLDADGTLTRFRYLVDGVIGNKAMMITVVAFAVTILLVYIIRRLPVDHCWTYAMVAGALMNIVILMLGDLKYRTNISIFGTILGSIVAVGIVKILQFFVFNVDYSRTEHVQFEDDEYYYYVKAVPKMSVAISDKTVTRIDTRKPEGQHRVHSSAVVSAQQEHTHTTRNSGRYTDDERNAAVSTSASDSGNLTGNSRTTASASGTGRSRNAGSSRSTAGNTTESSTTRTTGSRSTASSSTRTTGSRSTTSSSAGTAGSRSTASGSTGAVGSRSTAGSSTRTTGSRSMASSSTGTTGSRSTASSSTGTTGSSRSTTNSSMGTAGSRSTTSSSVGTAGSRSTTSSSTRTTGSSRSTTNSSAGTTGGSRSTTSGSAGTTGGSRSTTSGSTGTAGSRSNTTSSSTRTAGNSRSTTSNSMGTTGSRSTVGTNAGTTSRSGGQS